MTHKSASQIEDEAALWVIRIDREGRHQPLVNELNEWLTQDSRHQGALLQAEATWHMLDGIVQPVAGNNDNTVRAMGRRRLLIGGAAALAASLAAAVFVFNGADKYNTEVGEIRRVPLSDGSIAAMNTSSETSVKFEPTLRVANLQKGEAWFQVAKDKRRPFVVEAGNIRVQAVGTAFSVRRQDGGADILVSEGVVEAWVEGIPSRRTRIAAGQRAFIATNAVIAEQSSTPSDIDRALAWRSGKIDLDGEPLAHAVAEFNRYNEIQIEVADPSILNERFYGIFRTDDPRGFAKAVQQSLDVPVVESNEVITLGGK